MSVPEKSAAEAATKAPAPTTVRAAMVLIGFTAVVAQIVLLRELIVVFSGNEMSLGIMLATWMLWTAVGSGLLGRAGARARQPQRVMAALQVLVAFAFPAAVLLVRASKLAFRPVPGELLGPAPMFWTSLLALSVFCLISGWLFAAGSRVFSREANTSLPGATGSVYLLEALGAGMGGILTSLLLIQHLEVFEIAALLALLNLICAAQLAITSVFRRRALLALLIAIFAFLVFPFASRRLEASSLAQLWRGFRVVAWRHSAYGNLVLMEGEGSRTLFENGLVAFTAPDPEAAEEAVHYALLQHPLPQRLLLLGGGVNGSVAQALLHPSLQRLDYVELDPAIFALAEQYFPREWAAIRAAPRVHVHPRDGRLFLKTVAEKYDVIIVNLPDPQTAQLNRFYTREFFREARTKMAAGGVLSFQLRAAENYISPELGEFLRCIHKTLGAVFPEVAVIPGETVHFFAATQPGVLSTDPQVLIARLRARRLPTEYVREYYLSFRMTPDRRRELEEQLRERVDTPVNRDFAPVAYYFGVGLWSTRFDRAYREWFHALAQVDFALLTAVTALFLVALAAALRRTLKKERRARLGAAACVAAMGFTLIGLEVLLLLGFQAIYGYVYHQLAIVIAGFMVGMALGSRWALRPRHEPGKEMRILALLQATAAFAALLLYLLFVAVGQLRSATGLLVVSQLAFPLLALLCGLLGGYQFPIASRIFFAKENPPAGAGTLYALDLAGACLGAILLSAYLVPVFGFLKTGLLMAVVNLPPAALAATCASPRQA